MGNIATCCKSDVITGKGVEDLNVETTPVLDGPLKGMPEVSGGQTPEERIYKVTLSKKDGGKLGLDVDFMAERSVLPIMKITGGLSEQWNVDNPSKKMNPGDAIIEVNGLSGNVALMLEKCKSEEVLQLTLCKALNYDFLIKDIEKLVEVKQCGPILVRLSWHDAGVFNGVNGCPNAAMRLPGGGEHDFGANAGLPSVALELIKPITEKYCPYLISNADLWVLAANIAIRVMGGPDIPARFGRVDAKSVGDGVDSQVGRLPDGDKGAQHLRDIFGPKGFDDKAIVALSGAHTVGSCHLDRSGFDGPWTDAPLTFDNAYFKDLLTKSWTEEKTSKGNPQFRSGETMMLISDLALTQDPDFKQYVTKYAEDKQAWFDDFTQAWVKLQELGCSELREIL
eukprot:gb/GFBE01005181.1/.p1 GENE.gb/GFBE01005181.1/~~gb/GFBE01005181.1/.p1  ORF type:complete len:396 (+),score=107.78 gb/GFBE01005181.1/:1-1188(+)